MSGPIVFIIRNRVIAGKQEDFIRHYRESLPSTQAGKPGTLVQLAYADEDLSEVIIVRVFPDAEALDDQLRGADERSKAAYRFIEPASIEIYGAPNNFALEMIQKVAGAGVAVSLHPEYLGGFIRSRPG